MSPSRPMLGARPYRTLRIGQRQTRLPRLKRLVRQRSEQMAAAAAKEAVKDDEDDEDTSSNTTDLKPPLGPGSSVIVDYKGVLRTGEVVKVVGDKLHVKLDDDDAAYRVINTDKVVE